MRDDRKHPPRAAAVRHLTLALGGLTLAAAPVLAQETGTAQGDLTLAPIVVEADKTPQTGTAVSPRNGAAVTTETTRKTLDAAQVQSFADLGQSVDAGVSYDAGSRSVALRGLSENRVLTTIDGVPIPWLDDGARGVQGGATSFDFNMLSALDIVRGGDSSLTGSGALAGAVALKTLEPEDVLTDGKTFGGISKITTDSSTQSWGVNQAVAGRFGRTTYLVQGGYGQGHATDNRGTIGGTGASRTEPDPADTRGRNLLVKLRRDIGGGQVLGVTAESYDSTVNTDVLSQVGPTYSDYAETDRVTRQRLSFSYDATGRFFDTAHVAFYLQRLQLETVTEATRLTSPAGQYDRDDTLGQRAAGLTGNLTRDVTVAGLTHTLLLAFDAQLRTTSQYAGGFDTCPAVPAPYSTCSFLHTNQSDMPNSAGATLGLALQDTIALAGGSVRLIPGLRYDYYRETPQETAAYSANPTVSGLPAESSGGRLSPKLRAEWDVGPKTLLYAQVAQGFRAPSATELYLRYGGSGTYLVMGNPALKPETVTGLDLGARFGDTRLGGRLSLFDNYYRNFIDQVSVTPAQAGVPAGTYPFGITQYVNRAHVHIYGAELSGQWAFAPDWSARASVAYAQGKDTDLDQALNSVAPLKGVLALAYTRPTWGADVALVLAAARNEVEDPSSDLNKMPGYGIVNLGAWWEPPQAEGVRVQAAITNVFNKTYWDLMDVADSSTRPKAYYTAPGRTLKIAMTYRF